MGTRADFYVGRGQQAEWIGSISYDGYPGQEHLQPMFQSETEAEFRRAVERILDVRPDHATKPSEGWPWPWDDSRTTDFAYAWCEEDSRVRYSNFGEEWEILEILRRKAGRPDRELPADQWPNMRARRASPETVMAKSGLIVLREGSEESQ